jgi:Uma2 family endonuclease
MRLGLEWGKELSTNAWLRVKPYTWSDRGMVVPIAEPQTKRYTADEYLALEMESEIRNEYDDGEILPMAGGTPNHNELTGNLVFILKAALKGKPYSVFVADQRVAIPDRNLYAYPDVMVLSRPLELKPGRKDTVMNPILIMEVLSDSTKAYDRDQKFAAYRSIPTFQEYVLIEQTHFHVEHYMKQATNQWLFTEYDGQDAIVMLASISVEIPLLDLYENVEFEDSNV